MLNVVYDFATTSPFSQLAANSLVLASRALSVIPAIEMAINIIKDINSFRYSSDNKLDIQAESLSENEIAQAKENLKKERWKKLKTLSQDTLGALFFGFCACSQIPQAAVAGALIFLVHSKLNWKKENVNLSTQTTGLLLTLLSRYKNKIIKAIVKSTKNILVSTINIIKKISKTIIKGINGVKKYIISVAKSVKKIFKLVILYPLKLIKSSVKAIAHVASKSLSFIKGIGKVSASVAKFLFKHPIIGIGCIGMVALGIIALKGGILLSPLATIGTGVMTLANKMAVISKAMLPILAKSIQAIFSGVFNALRVLTPMVLKGVKFIPNLLQLTTKVVWKVISTVVVGITQLFLKVIVG